MKTSIPTCARRLLPLNGILNALLAVLEPGDEVLMTDPIYVGLINRMRLASGVPIFVQLDPSSGEWRLDLGALRGMHTSKVRVVLMMSPSMPTGATFTRDEWEAISDICRAKDCWLIYDAANIFIPHRCPACASARSRSGLSRRSTA